MSQTVLVVEDDTDILNLVTYNLQQAGFRVLSAQDGYDGLELAGKHLPDLIVLDLLLPGIEGLEVCRLLKRHRETAHIPVIMLTARGEEIDRIVGFEVGAEDYIVKPFSPRELLLRVRALLRRIAPTTEAARILKHDQLTIDLDKYMVFVGDEEIRLTATEFKTLVLLAEHPGRVYTRESLMNHVWGQDFYGLDRTVDTHVSRLRKKLGDAAEMIQTVHGIGYRFRE